MSQAINMYRRCSLGVALKDSLDEFILVWAASAGTGTFWDEHLPSLMYIYFRTSHALPSLFSLCSTLLSGCCVVLDTAVSLRVPARPAQSQQIHPELAQKTLAQFDTSITQL